MVLLLAIMGHMKKENTMGEGNHRADWSRMEDDRKEERKEEQLEVGNLESVPAVEAQSTYLFLNMGWSPLAPFLSPFVSVSCRPPSHAGARSIGPQP